MTNRHEDKSKREHPVSENGLIYTVRIEPHPDEEQQYTDEQTYRRKQISLAKWLNWISAGGGVVALAALIALIINARIIHQQLGAARDANKISQRASDLAYRPYIRINAVGVSFVQPGSNKYALVPSPQSNELDFAVEIKNFGPVPETNFSDNVRVFVGTEELKPGPKVPDAPFTFFPGEVMRMAGRARDELYHSVLSGSRALTLYFSWKYDGPSQTYQECDKQ